MLQYQIRIVFHKSVWKFLFENSLLLFLVTDIANCADTSFYYNCRKVNKSEPTIRRWLVAEKAIKTYTNGRQHFSMPAKTRQEIQKVVVIEKNLSCTTVKRQKSLFWSWKEFGSKVVCFGMHRYWNECDYETKKNKWQLIKSNWRTKMTVCII
jgi:hypothetical protein